MLKQIRWSVRANQDRIEILEYWVNRNKSSAYSSKLNLLFQESIRLIAEIPELGKPSDYVDVKIKIIRDYLIFYRVVGDILEIITIRDSRKNPKNFQI